jgi:hypothetical protein
VRFGVRLKRCAAAARSYKAQQVTGEPPRVLGCLLGTHTARTVDVANSFEIKYDGFANGVPQLDAAFLTQKQEQCAARALQREEAACAVCTNLDARRPNPCRACWRRSVSWLCALVRRQEGVPQV